MHERKTKEMYVSVNERREKSCTYTWLGRRK
jgi:hypothetical protein